MIARELIVNGAGATIYAAKISLPGTTEEVTKACVPGQIFTEGLKFGWKILTDGEVARDWSFHGIGQLFIVWTRCFLTHWMVDDIDAFQWL